MSFAWRAKVRDLGDFLLSPLILRLTSGITPICPIETRHQSNVELGLFAVLIRI